MSVGQRVTLARADCIVPEYQRVEIGAQVKLAPEVALTVALVEPQCALVCAAGSRWARCQLPTTSPGLSFCALGRVDQPGSWSGSATGICAGGAPLVVEPAELISFVMSQRMLRSIRSRAESAVLSAPSNRGEFDLGDARPGDIR